MNWLQQTLIATSLIMIQKMSITYNSSSFIFDDLHYYELLDYDPKTTITVPNRHKRSTSHQNKLDKIEISFSAHNQKFHLELKRDYSIFHNDIKIHDGRNQQLPLNHGNLNLYDGHVKSSLSSSKGYCFGSISDGVFDGQILTDEGTYYITKIPQPIYHALNYTAHSIIYHENHVKEQKESQNHACGVKDNNDKWMSDAENFMFNNTVKDKKKKIQNFQYFDQSIKEEQKAQKRPKRHANSNDGSSSMKWCSLYIRTDGMLWEAIQKEEFGDLRSSLENDEKTRAKITELIHKHVKKLNTIMKNTKFGDKIRTIVFKILRLDILKPDKPECEPFCEKNLDSSPFLDVQSQADHSNYCLAYAFTYRDWTEGTLGVAWIAGLDRAGGICEDHQRFSIIKGSRSRNTGVVTLKNSGRRIPIPKSELTFAHEVGHNLGSPHDEDKDCLGNNDDGKFLMYAYSNSGNLKNHQQFSKCSRDKIGKVFDGLKRLHDDGCLKPFDGSFCGDGILQEGEECDCGVDEVECKKRNELDSCYPKDHAKGCKLKPNVQCSYPSSGPCCNATHQFDDETCCSNCELSNKCREKSICNGTTALCPEAEPKNDSTTTCNGDTQVCLKGECMGSICEHPDIQAKECSLPFAHRPTKKERREQCQIACRYNGTCYPLKTLIKTLTDTNKKESNILMNLTQFQMTPGSSCNDGKGFCDVLSRCRDLDPEGAIQSLAKLVFNEENANTIAKFLRQKWYIALGSVIGFIVIMAGFIRCLSVHTHSSNPRLPPAYDIGGTLRRPQRALRRMVSHDADPNEPPPAYDDLYDRSGRQRQHGMEMSDRSHGPNNMHVTNRGGNRSRQ